MRGSLQTIVLASQRLWMTRRSSCLGGQSSEGDCMLDWMGARLANECLCEAQQDTEEDRNPVIEEPLVVVSEDRVSRHSAGNERTDSREFLICSTRQSASGDDRRA